MKNPWEEIELVDYENHMKLSSVLQHQTMNIMMKKQLYQYPAGVIMILGIAGGNGLEHIDPRIIKKVYGVDINKVYLEECEKRYPQLNGKLHLFCVDLLGDVATLPYADLVVANLLLEYIGCACFQKVIKRVEPRYVSCIIQINTDACFVSESPYSHAFDGLSRVYHKIEERSLIRAMENIDYCVVLREEISLPNHKKLVRLDFEQQIKNISERRRS